MGHPSFALTIVVFATLVKLILFPLTIKQAKSTRYTQLLQPKVKSIQLRFKGNQEKIAQETMALYKKHKISPVSGCLPLLVQLPIIIALFSSIRGFISRGLLQGPGSGFFWIENLSQPDPWILPIIVAISTYAQSKYSMATTPQPDENAQSMQASMTYFMPIMMGFFARTYTAGLSIYWITFSVISIIQQWISNKMLKNITLEIDPDDLISEEEAEKIERKLVKSKQPKKSKVPKFTTIQNEETRSGDYGKPLDFTKEK